MLVVLVIAEGSIDSVLSDKHYNRGVRLHKIMYEAITKLLLDDFEAQGRRKIVNWGGGTYSYILPD